MASNAPVAKQDALSFMTQITPNVYLYRPDQTASAAINGTPKGRPPKLILICGWMGAQNPHLAKYILPYQALYPGAQILIIKCQLNDFLKPTAGYSKVLPAVPIIRAAIDPTDPAPQLAVHYFSNGGSSMVYHLYSAFKQTAKPGEDTLLPLHTTVIDSAPGEYSWNGSILAMTAGLSSTLKLVLWPVIRIWLLSYFLWHFLGRSEDPLQKLAKAHNLPEQVKEVRRTYVYSKGDKLIGWKGVEKWANHAEVAGFVVRKEKFESSAHVAHVREDEERYWRIVKETWEGQE